MNDEKTPKTTDERIDAIAQSVELLASMQVKSDERIDAIAQSTELLAAMQVKTEKQIRRLGRYIRMIVLDHEARLLAIETNGNDVDDEEE